MMMHVNYACMQYNYIAVQDMVESKHELELVIVRSVSTEWLMD